MKDVQAFINAYKRQPFLELDWIQLDSIEFFNFFGFFEIFSQNIVNANIVNFVV